jgi:ABC-type antimicrobial peptide transport system permease subunit
MRSILTSLLLLFVLTSVSYAQSSSDSITIKKIFGGYKFLQNNQPLTIKQLGETMKSNPEASKLFQQAKPNATAATLFGIAGGFMVGWPVGTAIGGGKPSWELAGIGAGLIAISIPFSAGFNKNAKAAVAAFNQGNRTSTLQKRTEFQLALAATSVGLTIKF